MPRPIRTGAPSPFDVNILLVLVDREDHLLAKPAYFADGWESGDLSGWTSFAPRTAQPARPEGVQAPLSG